MIKNLKIYKKNGEFGVKRAVAVVASLGVLAVGVGGCGNEQRKNTPEGTSGVSATEDTSENLRSIYDLGAELSTASDEKLNAPSFGSVVSGNFDAGQVVVGSDGNVYVNSEAAERAASSGSTTIDDRGGTLDTSGGRVTEREEGYVVQDSNGNTVSSGNGSTPSDYVYDENINAYVEEDEAGKYVYADANYYDKETGDLIIAKGDRVSKETLERAKRELTTTKPNKSNNVATPTTSSYQPSQQTPAPSSSSDTYSNYYTAPDGSVWASKAAYDDYMKSSNTDTNTDDEVWVEVDGNLMTEEEFEKEFGDYQKQLTR